jgi:hypothetical protein
MSRYTITISADDGAGAQTTVSVDVERGATRITELKVKAPAGAGLSGQQLSSVDYELLLRAILPATGETTADTPAVPSARRGARVTDGRRGRRSSAGEAKGVAARRRARAGRAEAATPSTGRVYRRMPDDLADVYAQTRSVTAVARHYDVPRHTAQGWMNRLRSRG